MARSMTGFGSAAANGTTQALRLDIRSVNHRHMDVKVHGPSSLLAGFDMKRRLQAVLSRRPKDERLDIGPRTETADGITNKEQKGRHRKTKHLVAEDSKRRNARSTEIAQEVVAVAKEIGCTPAQVALNWVRQRSQPVIPIIGARKLSQIEDSLKCLDYPLEAEHISRLEAVSAIEPGFPHEFLSAERVRNIIFGSTQDQIENHRT